MVDLLDEIYSELLLEIDHINVWKGTAIFAKKPDCEWTTFNSPVHEVVQNRAEILEWCVLRDPSFQTTVTGYSRIFAIKATTN
ncbi:hypothetical protein [Bradyrhizobium sp. ORS 111]|uniref:hypothetical protein n=1 Tax=Bradyrhizobium sp. ORS 111 TaxID=1685958 RepID=UPI00388DE2BE